MSGYDMMIDPLTRDYVDDGEGGFAYTDSAGTAVYHQVTTRLNEWWGDPDAGGLIHVLAGGGAGEADAAAAKNYLLSSLQALVDVAIIADPTVEVERQDGGRLVCDASSRDLQAGVPSITKLSVIVK